MSVEVSVAATSVGPWSFPGAVSSGDRTIRAEFVRLPGSMRCAGGRNAGGFAKRTGSRSAVGSVPGRRTPGSRRWQGVRQSRFDGCGYATRGLAPRGRERASRHLTAAEWEEILRGSRAGDSYRATGKCLGRAPLPISREVAADGSRQRYRAWKAERQAAAKAGRPKVAELARYARWRRKVDRLLAERWSPQQIPRRLKPDHPRDPGRRMPHETICQPLYLRGRSALRKQLTAYLRTGRTLCRCPSPTASSVR